MVYQWLIGSLFQEPRRKMSSFVAMFRGRSEKWDIKLGVQSGELLTEVEINRK